MTRRTVTALLLAGLGTACASTGGVPDRKAIDSALRERANYGLRSDSKEALPPGVSTADGLTADEAVAIALWNNPAFQVALSDLGLARADLIDARQIRNPVFSLLFPWGPKQLESTLQLPIDAIWQRPRRIRVASLNTEATAARLMSDGLGVVAQARSAYVEVSAGEARLRLAREGANVWGRLRWITEARLREGEISELEARSVRSEAAMADATARGVEGDRDLTRIRLDSILGVNLGSATVLPVDDMVLASCDRPQLQRTEALASRPDVRAAELAIEAAGAQIGLERSRVLALTATLDANGEGKQGFELGPGLALDLPFNRNAGPRARAAALLEQATWRYSAVRNTVEAELRSGNQAA